MEPEKIGVNGFTTSKGNYIWGGALTLAWHELKDNIIMDEVKVISDDAQVQDIVTNYNQSAFTKDDLSKQCYYVCSGLGNATIRKINTEVRTKFPSKTTPPLKQNLLDQEIISYAYFLKEMKFTDPFKKKKITFKTKKVDGFQGATQRQKKQIKVHQYKDRDNFIARVSTKSKKDQIFLLKSEEHYNVDDVIKIIQDISNNGTCLKKDDKFEMPKIKWQQTNKITKLIGQHLANNPLFKFSDIFEVIKLQIDETGVKLENEGAIKVLKCKKVKPVEIKYIILDKPFWIIMRETGCHPYFVAYVNSPS